MADATTHETAEITLAAVTNIFTIGFTKKSATSYFKTLRNTIMKQAI